MGRRKIDSKLGPFSHLILLLIGLLSCVMIYVCASVAFRSSATSLVEKADLDREDRECCRGIEHLELWGNAVKWGSSFKVKSSEECCRACKKMCKGETGPCLCDSWVFCGDKEACGPRFGEGADLWSMLAKLQKLQRIFDRSQNKLTCWLKKQKDTLDPDRRESGDRVTWTSGLIFGKGEGIVGLETEYGILHIKLFPDCAPHSVTYILDLLALRHCAGCQFYRAESRGNSWDSGGNHIKNAPFGPPFALIQGTLEAHGTIFKDIQREDCPTIRRGSVAWVGSGPDFFISLANHNEWKKAYTVFGSVLPKDMEVAEKIAQLPTKLDLWSNINVSVLEKAVPLAFRRFKTTTGNLKSPH